MPEMFIAFTPEGDFDADNDFNVLLNRLRADWRSVDDSFDVTVWTGQLLVAVIHFRPGEPPTTVLILGKSFDIPDLVVVGGGS